MSTSTTLTIRVDPAVKADLERLASDTRRSKSFLAAEALTAYVRRELEIIDGIQQGLDDVRRGDVVPQDEVKAGLAAIISRAESRKA